MSKIVAVLTVGIMMMACNTNTVTSDFRATGNGSWNKDDHFEFTFPQKDTIDKHHIFINVRNDGSFEYNNLFLITQLDYPNGNSVTDTLEFEMALPDGTWLGQGLGSLKENKLWYKENIVFSASGVYTLKISHAMRKNGNVNGIENLDGITDVGFDIVKSNN